jgi:hypothetical protein
MGEKVNCDQSSYMKLLIIAAVLLPLFTHAQKEIKSIDGQATMFVNEQFSKREFKKILIISPIVKLSEYDKIIDQFKKIGVTAIPGVQLLPPIKEYTNDEVKQICEKNNIDGIVNVEVTDTKQVNGITPLAAKSDRIEMKLSLNDLSGAMAVNFIGRSFAPSAEKGVLKFVKVVIEELDLLM